jgi:inner membrane protein
LDNLCHTLVGAALGEAGVARRTPLATATLLIGANLPDVDGFTYMFSDGPTALAVRRGWTHGILAMAVLPLALAASMTAWDRLVRRRRPGKSRGQALRACTRRSSRVPARFSGLLVAAFVSVLSHPLLDFLNTYGVRFLYPFSNRWFYGDAIFIVDPWVWIALALGIGFSRARRKRGRPSPSGPARTALAVVLGYVAIMIASSFAGRSIARRAVIDSRREPPGRVLVAPFPLDPFHRLVVLEESGGYRFGELRWRPLPVLRLAEGIQTKNDSDPNVIAARRLRPVRRFLVWARFPFYEVRPAGTSTEVELRDARYPGRTGSWASVRVLVTTSAANPSGMTMPVSR